MKSLFSQPIILLFVFIFSSLQGAIENQGVIGGPFHGIGGDDSGQVLNQVGAFADFAVPTGIVGESSDRTLGPNGESSLSAYLRLDDGTLTVLKAEELNWSTESKEFPLPMVLQKPLRLLKKHG